MKAKTDATKKKPKLSMESFMVNTVKYVGYAMMILAMILMAPLIMCYGYYLFVSTQIRSFRENLD